MVSMLGEKEVLYQQVDHHAILPPCWVHFIHFVIGVGDRHPRPLARHGEGKSGRLVAHETCRSVTTGKGAWYGVMRTTKTERAPWCMDDHARNGDCSVRGCGDNRCAVHVASRHFAGTLQFLRTNPHTTHGRPIVAFAFLVYKFTCRLVV